VVEEAEITSLVEELSLKMASNGKSKQVQNEVDEVVGIMQGNLSV
jgi:hypothetical protein